MCISQQASYSGSRSPLQVTKRCESCSTSQVTLHGQCCCLERCPVLSHVAVARSDCEMPIVLMPRDAGLLLSLLQAVYVLGSEQQLHQLVQHITRCGRAWCGLRYRTLWSKQSEQYPKLSMVGTTAAASLKTYVRVMYCPATAFPPLLVYLESFVSWVPPASGNLPLIILVLVPVGSPACTPQLPHLLLLLWSSVTGWVTAGWQSQQERCSC